MARTCQYSRPLFRDSPLCSAPVPPFPHGNPAAMTHTFLSLSLSLPLNLLRYRKVFKTVVSNGHIPR